MEKLGAEVSLLGFGCMRFPFSGGEPDMEKVQEMISRAYESGVNYYDTAYVYNGGKSEEAIGRALKRYPRESYYLADKLPIWCAETEEDLQKLFDTSLRRLGVEYIDFYLLHSQGKENWEKVQKLHAVEFCEKLRAQGKIRHLGFSFHDKPAVFREILGAHDWDFVQIQLNYLDWEAQRASELYEAAEAKGVPCIVMEPLRGGSLANPPEHIAEVFRKAEPERSVASFGLRYCASLPNVKVILSGMSTLAQVEDNLATFSDMKPLSQAERGLIGQARALIAKQPRIGCTACRYCMPCPSGVNIPSMFHLYNEYMQLYDKGGLNWQVKEGDYRTAGPDQCVRCGACMSHCPQHLEIPDELVRVKREVEKALSSVN